MNSTTQKKIPVLDTIRYAYAFTFGHLGTIIGLIWLPMVIFAVAGYFVMSYYYGVVPEAVSGGNPVALGQAGLVVMGWSLVSLMLSAIMYVAVTRQALGLRQGPAVVHFALGAPELRVFAGFIGLFALLLLFLLADAVVLAVIKGLGHSPVMTGVAGAVYLAGLLAIVYAAVRLSFLFIPAGVAEEKIGLAESWQLTRGNFWNIFAVGVAVFLPLRDRGRYRGSGRDGHRFLSSQDDGTRRRYGPADEDHGRPDAQCVAASAALVRPHIPVRALRDRADAGAIGLCVSRADGHAGCGFGH